MNKHCYLLLTLMFFLICCITELFAQDTSSTEPPPEFILGSFVGDRYQDSIYNSFYGSGMNTLVHFADDGTKPWLENQNVIAANADRQQDWISHYATSYYSKWESEENHLDIHSVGVKHKYGRDTTWLGKQCWSTKGILSPVDSLVYGPHYRQEKLYKRWLYGDRFDVKYTPRFNMALDYDPETVNPNQNVCVIKVVHRFATILSDTSWFLTDTVLVQDTLKVADFNSDGSFKDFKIDPPYEYDERFLPDQFSDRIIGLDSTGTLRYSDSNGDNGIQFWVDWLMEGTLCTLYVNYAEVYDNFGWNDFIEDSSDVISKIQTYAQNYSHWDNIKYWWGQDEPYTIDAYTPMRVVDEIVRGAGGAPLITEFYPDWHIIVNGDSQLVRYYNMVQPQKLMIDYYPFSKVYYPIRPVDLESTREQFQICHTLQPDFWYVAQGFGIRDAAHNWCSWRRPDSSELKATVMLALAHGVKGIMFWKYESYDTDNCSEGGYFDNIVGKAPNYPVSELWYLIKNNFAPRLKGKLGKTLLTLDYTGNFLRLQYFTPTQNPTPDPVVYDYLTLHYCGTVLDDMNWHVGFFTKQGQTDNKHFLLANLRTNESVEAKLIVSNNIEYENVSFTDIEGGSGRIDTTIGYNSSVTYCETMPAGEGRLYRVAPVARYGGRLIYDEEILRSATLYDEMTIENGATLTVYGNYTAEANIIVKNGNIVNGENGKIIFKHGTKLIIEGTANINGTSEDKLTLKFIGPETENGIVVDSAGSLIISNCIIEDAETGIKAMMDARTVNVQYVDFNNCRNSSITLLGETGGAEVVRQVRYCTITNSSYGISAANLYELIIQENYITNTDLGIYLSNVSRVVAFGNRITTNTETLQGIFAESTGGKIYTNIISGHTYGIHLGNSSPDVGGNDITDCKYHGMYVGSGSLPNMVGRLIYNQNNHLWYPVSGYNKI